MKTDTLRAPEGLRQPAVTNTEFLDAVAGKPGVPMWVCAFAGRPGSEDERWGGRPHQSGTPLAMLPTQNTYFSTAEVDPTSGKRNRASFERMFVLVADDADRAGLAARPSYVIETSPGKFQIGYFLVDDAESRDYERCCAASKAMGAAELLGADKSGNNPVRYVRLPEGCNTKYDGHPAHRLVEWHPERRYTVTEALAAFGVASSVAPATTPAAADVCEWVDNGPGRLDVVQAEALIVSGESMHGPLCSLASHHASKGHDADTIYTVLAELMERSEAKASRSEDWKVRMSKLRDTIRSALEKFGTDYSTKVDYSDLGNTNLLAKLTSGNLRWVSEARAWLAWAKARWEVDSTGERAAAAAGLVAEHYAKEVSRLTLELRTMDSAQAKRHQKTIDVVAAWEKACRGRRGIDNMLALAKTHRVFVMSEAQLDTNPYLLGVQNGVVDLRTSELRPDAREDFVTRRSAYAYRADAPALRWQQFVAEVTGYPIEAQARADTGEVIPGTVGRYTARPLFADYLQRALGYSTTGLTHEHKMFTVTGEHGSNGKNVMFDTVKRVLGSYACTASEKLLLSSRRDTDANSATPALVALKGSRLAVSSEPPANATFDSSTLKALTGEVTIPGRGLHAGAGEIAVTWKLWLLCNAKPKVEHLEQAIVGRILMLPFDRQWNRPGVAEHDPMLPDPDKYLGAALQAEGEGILAWLVAGAAAYLAEGLEPCAEVKAATLAYFNDQRDDPVGKWLSEQEMCAPQVGTQASVLFGAFTAWRIGREASGDLRAGASPATQRAFSFALTKHKVENTVQGVSRWGVKLVNDFDAQPDAAAFAEAERLFGDLA